MALLKKAVFIASRFAEFAELREAIKRRITDITVVQLSAVDLNDGNVSHRPPLQECLGYVRRAEFLILLLGDGYGEPAPGHKKSITHLEYEEAIREGSNTRVLVFCIGNSYRDRRIAYAANNEQLALLQRQVHDNHTLGFFEPDTPVDGMAKEIVDRLLNALYEMSFGALAQDADDEFGSDSVLDPVESLAVEAEISSLEYRGAHARGGALADDAAVFTDTLSALRQPAAVRAQEQREEARRALDVGQFAVAVQHLRRALDLRPLDVLSNHLLAQIYVAMGDKKKAIQAVEYAERAARIAEYENNPIRAAASYVTAARASNVLEKHEEALRYAQRAVDIDDSKAMFHVELARQHAIADSPAEMLKELGSAFRLYPRSLQGMFADVAFKPFRQQLQDLVRQQKAALQKRIQPLFESEARLATLAAVEEPEPSVAKASVSQLISRGRRSAQRQFQIVQKLFEAAEDSAADAESLALPEVPESDEFFPFQHPGELIIERWYVEDNEVIQPGAKLFDYHFRAKSQSRLWVYRGREPVRLWSRADNCISSENPWIYTTVPLTWSPPHVSQVRARIAALAEAKTKLADVDQECRRSQHQLELVQSLSSSIAFKAKLVFAVALVAYGVAMLMVDLKLIFISLVSVAVAGIFGVKGWNGRRSHLEEVQGTQQRLIAATSSQVKLRAVVGELEQQIYEMRQSRAKTIENAREAIQLLESTLSKAPSICLPFRSLFAASTGDVVRIRQSQISDFKGQTRRDVVLTEDLPDWLGVGAMAMETMGLYRVIERSDERVVLSRRRAFVAPATTPADPS